jgi:hypothetical protein
LIWAFLPWIASLRTLVDRGLKFVLAEHTQVQYDTLKISWFSGVEVQGLRLRDASTTGDALSLERLHFDVEWGTLLSGGLDLQLRVERPHIRVTRSEEGTTNWHDLLDPRAWQLQFNGLPEAKIEVQVIHGTVELVDQQSGFVETLRELNLRVDKPEFTAPAKLQLVFACETSVATAGSFALQGEVAGDGTGQATLAIDHLDLGSFRPLLQHPELAWQPIAGVVTADLTGNFHPGESLVCAGELQLQGLRLQAASGAEPPVEFAPIRLRPNLQADLATGEWQNEALELDLGFAQVRGLPPARVQELVPDCRLALGLDVAADLDALGSVRAVLPSDYRQWSGRLHCTVAAGQPDHSPDAPLNLAGDGNLAGLKLVSAVLGEDLVLPDSVRWQWQGALDPDLGTLSLKPLTLQVPAGEFAAQASLEGSSVRASVDGLLQPGFYSRYLGGKLPDSLQFSADSQLHLEVEVPEAAGGETSLLQLSGRWTTPHLGWADNDARDLTAQLNLENNSIEVQLAPGATLNGGPLAARATLALAGSSEGAVHLDWQDGEARASLLPLLQYAVPVVAGLPLNDLEALLKIDFRSQIQLAANLSGPLPLAKDVDLWELLSKWTGQGQVELRDGQFTPASTLQQLLGAFKKNDRYEFEVLTSDFSLQEGFVSGPEILMDREKSPLLLTGRTGLDGSLNYQIHLASLLQGHKTGEKVREILGDQGPAATLKGTLLRPEVDLLQGLGQTLQGTTEGLLNSLQEDPKGTVDKLRDLFKKKRD